jgi:predicted Rossmann fold nucleotide-binding protein DprA/Smf involved in DNA uptake
MAAQRNRFVAFLANTILVVYAAAGSKTEALCLDLLKEGKPVYVLEEDANAKLLAQGAQKRRVEDVGSVLLSE